MMRICGKKQLASKMKIFRHAGRWDCTGFFVSPLLQFLSGCLATGSYIESRMLVSVACASPLVSCARIAGEPAELKEQQESRAVYEENLSQEEGIFLHLPASSTLNICGSSQANTEKGM